MPRQDHYRLSLQNHLVLTALEAHKGSAFGLRILLQTAIIKGFIDEARSHEIRPEVLVAAEPSINNAFSQAHETDQWYLDDQSAELCGELLTLHDRQLQTTPLHVPEKAIGRLERLRMSDPTTEKADC